MLVLPGSDCPVWQTYFRATILVLIAESAWYSDTLFPHENKWFQRFLYKCCRVKTTSGAACEIAWLAHIVLSL